MLRMKKYLPVLFAFIFLITLSAQERQELILAPQEIESLFFRQNLQLLAAKYEIDIVEAAVVQAKVWENPSLSINNLSFWSSSDQREGTDEVIPPMFGGFGRNTQFSIELSQLIYTARKRSKLIEREKAMKEIVVLEFEDIIRTLKTELNKVINELYHLQSYNEILSKQEESLNRLITSYRKQVLENNIAKSELLRLESSLLELENEINETLISLHEQQCLINGLLNINPLTNIRVKKSAIEYPNPQNFTLAELFESAYESRPDFKAIQMQTDYHEKALKYEKAQRMPDISVSAVYDRYGGVWKDFSGIGVSIDLPFFNRNQGNIKVSEANMEQSKHLGQWQKNEMEHQIAEVFRNYTLLYDFHQKTVSNHLFSELDSMPDVYAKNFIARNISILEYIDFMNAYKNNKQIVLTTEKNLRNQWEELQYVSGKTMIPQTEQNNNN